MITTGEASIQHYRVIGRQLIVVLMFYACFVATALPVALLVPWPPIRLPTNDNEFKVRSLAIWACVLGAALGVVLPLLSCVHVALWVERVSLPESCPRPARDTGCRHMQDVPPHNTRTSHDRLTGSVYYMGIIWEASFCEPGGSWQVGVAARGLPSEDLPAG